MSFGSCLAPRTKSKKLQTLFSGVAVAYLFIETKKTLKLIIVYISNLFAENTIKRKKNISVSLFDEHLKCLLSTSS